MKKLLAGSMCLIFFITIFLSQFCFASSKVDIEWKKAKVLNVDKPISFTIPTKNSLNWFKVNVLKANQGLKINIQTKDISVTQFDNNLQYFIYDEDTLKKGLNKAIAVSTYRNIPSIDCYKVNKPGTYYIKVVGDINKTPLTITYSLIDGDENEPNDIWKTATELKESGLLNFTINSTNDTTYLQDVDWFKVNISEANQTLNIAMETTDDSTEFNGHIHYSIYDETSLENNKNNSIAISQYSINPWTESFKFNKAGTYYIKVEGDLIETPAGIYYTITAPDQFENNDSWNKATPINANEPMSFTLTTNRPSLEMNDEDWFRFTTNADNQNINIIIKNSEDSKGEFESNINYYIYDERTLKDAKTDILFSGNYSKTIINDSYTIKKAGTYYIKIVGGINNTPLLLNCSVN